MVYGRRFVFFRVCSGPTQQDRTISRSQKIIKLPVLFEISSITIKLVIEIFALQLEVHRTGKFHLRRTTGHYPQLYAMNDCFQNWPMSMTKSKVDVCSKKWEKFILYFFNIKMPKTFDDCREMNVQQWQ